MSRQAPRHIPTIIGTNLKTVRLQRGLMQRDIARALDIDSFQVSRWERGKHRPSDETLFALADVLEVDVATFFAETSGELAA